jgi:hypothetical protein
VAEMPFLLWLPVPPRNRARAGDRARSVKRRFTETPYNSEPAAGRLLHILPAHAPTHAHAHAHAHDRLVLVLDQ